MVRAQPLDREASARHRRRHWLGNLRVTALLACLWFGISFGVVFFARDLNFQFLGWPFDFWVAAQGGPIAYVFLVWCYERRMDRLDRELGAHESASRGGGG